MDSFVNMHNGIRNHYMVDESKFAAERTNWPVTMAQLAARHCPNGPVGHRLAINSHGWPAQILLQPYVNFGNPGQFTAVVKRLLKPGSAIEILACSIAAFPMGAVAGETPTTNCPAPLAGSPEPAAINRGAHRIETASASKPALSGSRIQQLALRAMSTRKELLFPRTYTGVRTLSPTTAAYNAAVNGLLFCSRLANRTGCVVRTAMIPQWEEGEKSGNKWYDTPIGNWERHILDFAPSGDVWYVGFNVPRNVFRTHDMFGDGPLRVT